VLKAPRAALEQGLKRGMPARRTRQRGVEGNVHGRAPPLVVAAAQAELQPDIRITVATLPREDVAPAIMLHNELVISHCARQGPALPHRMDLADVVMLRYGTAFLLYVVVSLLAQGSLPGGCPGRSYFSPTSWAVRPVDGTG